ncbi:MAG: hypothetical protein GQF41_3063 [Candidatus Rifleibacterium amylolyticum]|nr:MAG: hypothetical protein GQF41_3063 [Candidatus Rifleibacterium amylolyticum]
MEQSDERTIESKSFLSLCGNRLRSLLTLFPEVDDAFLVNDPTGVMKAWRERALKILVFFTLILKSPIVIKLFMGDSKIVPRWAILLFILLFAASILIVLVEKISLTRRIYLLLGLKAITGITQLVSTQLLGSGRLNLMMLPVMGLILGGPIVAVHFAILCALAIGVTIYLISTGIIQPATVYQGIVPVEYLVLQGTMWLVEVLPHLYLIGHFFLLQERTLVAVSDARIRADVEAEKNRRMEIEINRIAEEERQKLGAELHDGLCQHLTATLLKCSSLMYVLKEQGKPEYDSVENIRAAVEKSIGMAYQVSRGLVPVRIEPDALVPALQELCRIRSVDSNKDCVFVCEADLQISKPEVALHLYRIASEAITNAIKHSGGAEVTVSISIVGQELFLEIADDGKGNRIENRNSNGMGLRIMEYRAGLIGGTLAIKDGESGGSCVVCRIPVGRL